MEKRDAISNKVRFEIFKRDKFTCQYCGKKSPEVILNVDHLIPVAKGGKNDLLNLITSCFECNNGKRDNMIDNSSIVDKQQEQLEILQERRNQLEMRIKWQKELSKYEKDIDITISKYINTKIKPRTINKVGESLISNWRQKYSVEQILKAIDDSAIENIKFIGNEIDEESVERFMSRIPAKLNFNSMTIVEQRICYVKAIARNRFKDWKPQEGAILFSSLIDVFKKNEFFEMDILSFIEEVLKPITINASNFYTWKKEIKILTEELREDIKYVKNNLTI